MRETWKYYLKKMLMSKYRVSKEQYIEMYPGPERTLRLLPKPRVEEGIGKEHREEGLYDESLSEDSNLLSALLSTSFPQLNYTERVHREGRLLPTDSGPIEVHKVLFDSGAQHASYISEELVNRNRAKLEHLIQKVNGEAIRLQVIHILLFYIYKATNSWNTLYVTDQNIRIQIYYCN